MLRGTLQIRQFNESIGETTIESRDPLSLLGLLAFPTDPSHLVRITAGDVAVLGCVDGRAFHSVAKPAHGIHRLERLRLAQSMRHHPVFSRFSAKELTEISLFFHKVKLHRGETLLREGKIPAYVIYVDEGTVERQSQSSQENSTPAVMQHGSFIAMEPLMHGRKSDATYTVQSDETVVFVLPPAVLEAFTGNRPFCAVDLLHQVRFPAGMDVMKMIGHAVSGFQSYVTDTFLSNMRNSFSSMLRDDPLNLNGETEKEIQCLIDLLRWMYPEMSLLDHPSKDLSVEHNPNESASSSSNTSSLSELVLNAVVSLFFQSPPSEESPSEGAKFNTLNDFSDGQVFSVLQSLLYREASSSAAYLLFLALSGGEELVSISRDTFEERAEKLGIVNEQTKSEVVEFFFDANGSSLSFDSFMEKCESAAVPAIIRDWLHQIGSCVQTIAPHQSEVWKQQSERRNRSTAYSKSVLKSHSPFQLLPMPLPVPYVMTYTLYFQNTDVNYWKYVLGGFVGEVFVRVLCVE